MQIPNNLIFRKLVAGFFLLSLSQLNAQNRLLLNQTIWKGTAIPLKKGTELYFQQDTLAFVDLEGLDPTDYYKWWVKGDTLSLQTIPGLSISCPEGDLAWYKIHWAQNGEKLLVKPLSDRCMPRFTALVSQSPWFRKREKEGERNDWHFLDPDKDRVAGAAIYSAYKLLKFRQSHPVLVAVIDCPVDYGHEDLMPVIWKNEKEIPGNQIDDDKNGYVDDINGWFFNCSKTGIPVEHEQPEETQIYAQGRKRFEGMASTPTDKATLYDFKIFERAKAKFEKGRKRAKDFERVFSDSVRFAQVLKEMLNQAQNPVDQEQMDQWKLPEDSFSVSARAVVKEIYQPRIQAFHQFVRNMRTQFPNLREAKSSLWKYDYNPDFNPRDQVSENKNLFWEKGYGSGFLKDPASLDNDHGTHIAGIIAGKRGNGKGIEGIADNVKIMTLGVVPSSGDERDKDVANAIKYAVDNGAKIINMSFAKRFSPMKKNIDEALKYADSKGVLLFHAGGNSGENGDSLFQFPICQYEDGKSCPSLINVGNSGPDLNENLVVSSSNWGKKNTHLFAPGKLIFSTTPGNTYENLTGTSMATPVVAGVAALLWSYFPELSAAELKNILLLSSFKPNNLVKKPGSGEMIPFSSLSQSGGIVNAKEAVILADKLVRDKKKKGRK
jgi:cell wall-associated protease